MPTKMARYSANEGQRLETTIEKKKKIENAP
jgi:hypothetical protein